MNKKLTIGQFIPQDSPIHHLDPRVKICWLAVYILMAFLAFNYLSLLFVLLLLIMFFFLSHIKAADLFLAIRPLLFIVFLTAFLNIFYIHGGRTLLDWSIFTVTTGGLRAALAILLRLFCMIAASSLFTLVTSLSDLVAGIERLLVPLKKVRFPVNELSLMIMITLRFIPTFAEELQHITDAQKSRGGRFDQRNLLKRLKAYSALVLPLFMSAFRRASELTDAIESRAYSTTAKRGHLAELLLNKNDYWALSACFLSLIMLLLLNRLV